MTPRYACPPRRARPPWAAYDAGQGFHPGARNPGTDSTGGGGRGVGLGKGELGPKGGNFIGGSSRNAQDTALEVAKGTAEGAADLATSIAKVMVLNALTLGGYGTYQLGKAVWVGYNQGRVVGAVNAVNPVHHLAKSAVDTYDAAARGDYRAAARSGVDVVATAVGAVTGVGAAANAVKTAAKAAAGAARAAADAGQAAGAAAVQGATKGAGPVRNAHLAGKAHPKTGVPFDKDGYPDFSAYRHPDISDVRIELSGSRSTDFARANAAAGLKETPTGYTWHHHQDKGLMQLVEIDVHKYTGHTGGFSQR